MDASVTSPDLVCGADGSMATLASQNIKCNEKCTVPSINNTKSTVNGLESVPSVDHGTQVDFHCEKGFVPTTTQSVFCGSIVPGQVDVSNIKCNRRECTPPVLSGGSYTFKSRSSDHGDGSVVYNDVITYTCDVTHTMDASVTSPDLVCGADGSMATLASQNIKCNENDVYEFRITSKSLKFSEARKECQRLGGDLITVSMGPQGEKYHKQIRQMVDSKTNGVWVGITDSDQEGVWKFVTDKTVFDPNKGNTLYRWGAGEPNNMDGSQNCGCVRYKKLLDDEFCEREKRGLCEIKIN